MWWPAEAQTNLPASSENRSAIARALRRLRASPVENHGAAVDLFALDAGIGVTAADEAREFVHVDGVVAAVWRKQDRRLPKDLAPHHHEAARQRSREALEMHAREHEVRGRRADVDAHCRELDVIRCPSHLIDGGVFRADVKVLELQIVHLNAA